MRRLIALLLCLLTSAAWGQVHELQQDIYRPGGLVLTPHGAAGCPTTRSWLTGALALGTDGTLCACTVGGSPGTWVNAGAYALAGHVAAPDPHTQYLTSAEGDLAYAAFGHAHALDNLTDVYAPAPASEQVLKFTGSGWEAADLPATPGGGAVVYFLDGAPSGVDGYGSLATVPASTPEDIVAASDITAADGEYLLGAYSTAILDRTAIEGGVWNCNLYAKASTADGVNQVVVRAYLRSITDVETELFDVTSSDLTTSVTLVPTATVQPSYASVLTDRLILKFFAKTDSALPVTISMYRYGTEHYSHAVTAITRGHNELTQRSAAGSHPAAAISYTAGGSLEATNAQTAIEELRDEKADVGHDHTGVYDPAGSAATVEALLSGYAPTGHDHTGVYDPAGTGASEAGAVASNLASVAENAGASDVGIYDTGGYFSATTVEGALQALGLADTGFAASGHTHTYALDDLSDVATAGAVSGNVLRFDGSSWAPATQSTPTLSALLLFSFNNADLQSASHTLAAPDPDASIEGRAWNVPWDKTYFDAHFGTGKYKVVVVYYAKVQTVTDQPCLSLYNITAGALVGADVCGAAGTTDWTYRTAEWTDASGNWPGTSGAVNIANYNNPGSTGHAIYMNSLQLWVRPE